MARTRPKLRPLHFPADYAIISPAGRPTGGLFDLGSTKAEGVRRMSSYEELMVVFTVIGLLLTVYTLAKSNRK